MEIDGIFELFHHIIIKNAVVKERELYFNKGIWGGGVCEIHLNANR